MIVISRNIWYQRYLLLRPYLAFFFLFNLECALVCRMFTDVTKHMDAAIDDSETSSMVILVVFSKIFKQQLVYYHLNSLLPIWNKELYFKYNNLWNRYLKEIGQSCSETQSSENLLNPRKTADCKLEDSFFMFSNNSNYH